ncbi:hypothetical protein BGW39_009243 [Mortierella sp. 14UC]|nr:hypothetical protein BGW39_009243 [Mortierella sp. 14UC]
MDWIVVQQYWLPVRQNQGLRVLDLRKMPQWMGGLAQEAFFYKTVGLLDRLVDMAMGDFEVDLKKLLVAQPRLLRYRTHLNLHNRHLLATTFSGLRLVECKGYISPMSMAVMLRRLPGLEELRLYSFLRGKSGITALDLADKACAELNALINGNDNNDDNNDDNDATAFSAASRSSCNL